MDIVLDNIIDQEVFSDWQSSLIHKKQKKDEHGEIILNSHILAKQQRVITHLSEKPNTAVNFLCEELRIKDTSSFNKLASLPYNMTAEEIKTGIPLKLEESIWQKLSKYKIQRRYASDPRFWFMQHIKWMQEGIFGNNLPEAFLLGGAGTSQEQKIRNFLRRTGGLPIIRGNISVLEDCRLAKSYWRGSLAEEISRTVKQEGGNLTRQEAHRLLHNNHLWSNLTLYSLRRITSLNIPRARAAFIFSIKQLEKGKWDKLPNKEKEVASKMALQAIGKLSNSYDLYFVDWGKIWETSKEAIEKAIH